MNTDDTIMALDVSERELAEVIAAHLGVCLKELYKALLVLRLHTGKHTQVLHSLLLFLFAEAIKLCCSEALPSVHLMTRENGPCAHNHI
jgi:hypothetical protein